jgi:hypothetical protein
MAKDRERRRSTSTVPGKPQPRKQTRAEQAEALRKLASPNELRKFALKREQPESFRKLALPPEQAEALRKLTAHDRAINDATLVSPEECNPQEKPLGRKARLAADAVVALISEGYDWPSREALRQKVSERIGEYVSPGTIKQVLARLRKAGKIDR